MLGSTLQRTKRTCLAVLREELIVSQNGYHKTSSSIVIAHTIHLQQNSSVLRSNLINAFRGDRSDRFN